MLKSAPSHADDPDAMFANEWLLVEGPSTHSLRYLAPTLLMAAGARNLRYWVLRPSEGCSFAPFSLPSFDLFVDDLGDRGIAQAFGHLMRRLGVGLANSF